MGFFGHLGASLALALLGGMIVLAVFFVIGLSPDWSACKHCYECQCKKLKRHVHANLR
jgi:hypothetical protein